MSKHGVIDTHLHGAPHNLEPDSMHRWFIPFAFVPNIPRKKADEQHMDVTMHTLSRRGDGDGSDELTREYESE